MPQLSNRRNELLARVFDTEGPTASVWSPSGNGVAAFRELQQQALRDYRHESRLTDHARRLRNRLIAGATVVALGVSAAAIGVSTSTNATASAPYSHELRKAVVDQTLLDLENSATELFYLKTTGAPSAKKDAAKSNLLSAAHQAASIFHEANVSGNGVLVEQIRNRVEAMNRSDLGSMGIDFVGEVILQSTAPASPVVRKRKI